MAKLMMVAALLLVCLSAAFGQLNAPAGAASPYGGQQQNSMQNFLVPWYMYRQVLDFNPFMSYMFTQQQQQQQQQGGGPGGLFGGINPLLFLFM